MSRFRNLSVLAALCFMAAPAVGAAAPGNSEGNTVKSGERLSAYLRHNKLVPGAMNGAAEYLPGLMLFRAELKQAHALARTQLLTDLLIDQKNTFSFYAELVDSLQPTGRMVLESTDADFLALNPQLDPVLQPGDEVFVPPLPTGLVVIGDSKFCNLSHEPGVEVRSYIQQCNFSADTVWLVQPTGQVHKLNTGLWNSQAQRVPMPGAWIVTSGQGSLPKAAMAERLAVFLATQGPARLHSKLPAISPLLMQAEPLRDLPVSSSTWGWVGLLQTPTARMRPQGSASFTLSRVDPYSRYSIMLQPFDWLEAGFRYTKITNRLFGPEEFSGDQKYLDKNIDAKLRLWKESAHVPEISIGLNDVGGTALFASEYLVANKRLGDFDMSLGIGWGYLGNAADLRNPLGLISDKFDNRPATDFGVGGELAAETYFRGRSALFGGVQWHTPWDNWVFKLEYEGNNYQSEPLSNPQAQKSRFNYGLVYRFSDSVNFHLGMERGDSLSVGISLFENFSTFNTPKSSDPKPFPVTTGPRPAQVDWKQTLQRVQQQTDWQVDKVEQRGSEVKLNVRNGDAAYYTDSVSRASAVLHHDLPESVKWFTLNYESNGVSMAQHVVDRDKFVAASTQPGQSDSAKKPAVIEGYGYPYEPVHEEPIERFSNKTAIGFRQVLGGADGFLYQFILANDTRVNITKNTWLDARLAYRLVDNFDKFKQRGDSRLPQVRTNLREYAVTSDFTIPNLTLKHMDKLATGHYYGMYAGLLEQMFAGAGGEYLYRPLNSRFAVGADVNKVRQRVFEQDFGLQDYEVNTGHVTAYIDTGIQNTLVTVSAGQYLAGDKGVTVDVSRQFNNGVRMGAFATRTNASAEDFGEGSFDKGIYMAVPFSAFFTKSIPGDSVFLWRPITRDGGAKLIRGFSLYDFTKIRNHRVLEKTPGSGTY